jgi:hypothetical protein
MPCFAEPTPGRSFRHLVTVLCVVSVRPVCSYALGERILDLAVVEMAPTKQRSAPSAQRSSRQAIGIYYVSIRLLSPVPMRRGFTQVEPQIIEPGMSNHHDEPHDELDQSDATQSCYNQCPETQVFHRYPPFLCASRVST